MQVSALATSSQIPSVAAILMELLLMADLVSTRLKGGFSSETEGALATDVPVELNTDDVLFTMTNRLLSR